MVSKAVPLCAKVRADLWGRARFGTGLGLEVFGVR